MDLLCTPMYIRPARVSKLIHSDHSFFPAMVPYIDLSYYSSLAILAAGLLSVGPVGVVAQTSTAVCLPSFGWVRRSTLPVFHSQNNFDD